MSSKTSSGSSSSSSSSHDYRFKKDLRVTTGKFLHTISDNVFAAAKIRFIRIEPEDSRSVVEFLNYNFLPQDYVAKSFNVTEDKVMNVAVENCIKDGCCVMATNQKEDIIGVFLSSIYRRGDWIKQAGSGKSLRSIFDFGNAAKARDTNERLKKLLGYDVWGLFDGHDCQTIAGDILLCTSSHFVGLASELLRQGESALEELKCDMAVCFTTSHKTQCLLRESCFTLRSVVVLSDFRDEHGKLYVKDVDEDSTARVMCKNLRL